MKTKYQAYCGSQHLSTGDVWYGPKRDYWHEAKDDAREHNQSNPDHQADYREVDPDCRAVCNRDHGGPGLGGPWYGPVRSSFAEAQSDADNHNESSSGFHNAKVEDA